MQEQLAINGADADGVPFVEIPRHVMWDLVDFLACRHTSVRYTYEAQHFVVYFPTLKQVTAQALLNDWTSHYNLAEEEAMRPFDEPFGKS